MLASNRVYESDKILSRTPISSHVRLTYTSTLCSCSMPISHTRQPRAHVPRPFHIHVSLMLVWPRPFHLHVSLALVLYAHFTYMSASCSYSTPVSHTRPPRARVSCPFDLHVSLVLVFHAHLAYTSASCSCSTPI